jgi:hypothetical protein
MLWTDSIFVNQWDLARIDSEIANVATSENVALIGTNSMLQAAQEEASFELQKVVIAFGGYLNSGDLTANHLAAVLNVGIGNSVRQKCSLQQVCVSGTAQGQWNHIRQWATFWALKVFYRDCFGRLGLDRYKNKLEYYKEELQRRITPNLYALGIPVVLQPLDRPAAYYAVNPGTWGSGNVSLVSGPGTSVATVWAAITYVCQAAPSFAGAFYVSPTQTNNAESAMSDAVQVTLADGLVMEVGIESLNPPTGQQNPAEVLIVVVSPLAATGWNLYVSQSQWGAYYLQNLEGPIPIDQLTYALSGNPTFSGYTANTGQYPNRRLSIAPTRQRA